MQEPGLTTVVEIHVPPLLPTEPESAEQGQQGQQQLGQTQHCGHVVVVSLDTFMMTSFLAVAYQRSR